MTDVSREERINQAFVKVANTLVNGYDVVDLLGTLVDECTELLNVQAGGLLLANSFGELELVASTSEKAETVEIMQLAAGAGPCVECYTSGVAVSVGDISESAGRWPEFSASALQQGFRSVHATPMRVRGKVIGTMNLLGTRVGELSVRDAALAQALADVAIIGILHERSLRDANIVSEQLQLALDTRIMIEQAKGVLAIINTSTMEDAFSALRTYSAAHDVPLRAVAEGILDRSIDSAELGSRNRIS